MTSNRGAGYSSNPSNRGRFDPFGQANKSVVAGGSSSLLPRKQEASSEEVQRGQQGGGISWRLR